jgi:hypothetical protein
VLCAAAELAANNRGTTSRIAERCIAAIPFAKCRRNLFESPTIQAVRLYLVSDEPVLRNATVATALIFGGVPFRDFEAWVNPAEFNGPDKYDGRLNFPVAAAFERTLWRGRKKAARLISNIPS